VVVSGETATEVVEWLRRHEERAETMYRLPTVVDPSGAGDVGVGAPATDPADRDEMLRVSEEMDAIALDWPPETA
jgi:hypothetical protein